MWSLNSELKTYFGLLKSYLESQPQWVSEKQDRVIGDGADYRACYAASTLPRIEVVEARHGARLRRFLVILSSKIFFIVQDVKRKSVMRLNLILNSF